jgi:hypothetical protein
LWEQQVQSVLYKTLFDIFVVACAQRDLKARLQNILFPSAGIIRQLLELLLI